MDHDFTRLRRADSDESLRPLEWSELAAKLAAARDLRRALGAQEAFPAGAGAGSFAARTARALAATPAVGRGVNLEPSANGKAARGICGTSGASPRTASSRDRGQG